MAYAGVHLAVEPSRAEVDAAAGPVLLEFGTAWCGHCIAAQPALQAALAGYDGIRHIKVEDGRGRPLGRSFQVRLWPTLVAVRDGREVGRLVRPAGREAIDRLLTALGDGPGRR